MDPWGSQERVEGPFQRFGAGWGTLREDRDGSGDPPGGP